MTTMAGVAALPGSLAANPNLDDWIRIEPDGAIVLCTGKVELGQGVRNAILRIGAEELDVSVERVRVQTGRSGRGPAEFMTVGSLSMMQSGAAMRQAAAEARAHLVGLAAGRLGVPADDLSVEDGVIAAPDGRSVTYWELLGGRRFGVTATGRATPKRPEDHRILGRRGERADLEAIVTGTTRYVCDLAGPGTRFGRVVRPPGPQATLRALDDSSVRRLPGVVEVVRNGSFLGVVAEREEQAVAAAAALRALARWDRAPALPRPGRIVDQLIGHEVDSWPIVDGAAADGPIPAVEAPPGAARTITSTFSRPHVMHGSIGPSSALAEFNDGVLTVTSHSQAIHLLRDLLAALLQLDVANVHTIHAPGPGSYGHNGADDVALDSALLARAVGGQVLTSWTREDEHAWEPYGPAMAIRIAASVDDRARIIAWNADVWSHAHAGRPGLGGTARGGRYDEAAGSPEMLAAWHLDPPRTWTPVRPPVALHVAFHQNIEPLYAVGERRLALHAVETAHRVSSLRGVGNVANTFAVESMMDELAEAAGADPLQFRLDHLEDERACAVLRAVAERAGWDGRKRPYGEGRGLAFARYANEKCYVAAVLDVSVDDATAQIHVDRAFIAADAGEVVDPEGLANQLEGGMVQALSWALFERVRWEETHISSVDWESYPIMRFSRAPAIEVELIDRPGLPFLGAGEASLGPSVAALANAAHAAIGVRLRHMPFTPDTVREAVLDL